MVAVHWCWLISLYHETLDQTVLRYVIFFQLTSLLPLPFQHDFAHTSFLSIQLSAVTPYNVDDLKAVVAKNTAMRQREMIEAEGLLREEAVSFIGWRESLSAIPTINQLQERANMFRQE